MIIPGKDVSNKIISQIENLIKDKKLSIRISAISFKGFEESNVYFKNIKKNAERLGIAFDILEVSPGDLINKIRELNNDESTDAIIISRPLPSGIDLLEVGDTIDPDKDLDCISPYNLGRLNFRDNELAPATAKASIDILKYNGFEIKGANALIINRSITVGRPLSQLLLNEDATVTVAHSKTKDINKLISQCDYVFLAVGKPSYLRSSDLEGNKVIVDIGINVVEGKIVGDFLPDGSRDNIHYTPVPGGVGTVTSAEILMNAVKLKLRRYT